MEFGINRAQKIGRKLVKHYRKHGVDIEIADYQLIVGLYRYIFTINLSPGTKVQAIFERADDIRFALGLYFICPFKDGISIRIAVSECEVRENKLLKILRSPLFSDGKMQIPLALGYDIMGKMHITDLAKLLHLLVVGPSGTGKSVALQCIVLSIITRCSVNSVRLILFDIGANSLSVFSSVTHLYHDIVKDVEEGITVLESLVAEMEECIASGEKACQALPFRVCAIDEFDDTIARIEDSQQAKRFVAALNSIIRRGRKAKIILILASHDPTLKNTKVNVSLIIPRLVFQCAKQHNSATAGVTGADKLPGGGALLFKSQAGTTTFLQGAYVTSAEIERVLGTAPEVHGDISMLNILEPETVCLSETGDEGSDNTAAENRKLANIAFWALHRKTVSSRKIQEQFRMSKRADGIVNKLYDMGIVGAKFAKQPRQVLPHTIEDLSLETLAFLERYGFTSKDIAEVLRTKNL